MFMENRIAPREPLALPMQLGDRSQCMTRDISPTGVFYETSRAERVGSLVDFQIDLDAPGGRMRLRAQGEIVRIEPGVRMNGVALRLLASRLEPVE